MIIFHFLSLGYVPYVSITPTQGPVPGLTRRSIPFAFWIKVWLLAVRTSLPLCFVMGLSSQEQEVFAKPLLIMQAVR